MGGGARLGIGTAIAFLSKGFQGPAWLALARARADRARHRLAALRQYRRHAADGGARCRAALRAVGLRALLARPGAAQHVARHRSARPVDRFLRRCRQCGTPSITRATCCGLRGRRCRCSRGRCGRAAAASTADLRSLPVQIPGVLAVVMYVNLLAMPDPEADPRAAAARPLARCSHRWTSIRCVADFPPRSTGSAFSRSGCWQSSCGASGSTPASMACRRRSRRCFATRRLASSRRFISAQSSSRSS